MRWILLSIFVGWIGAGSVFAAEDTRRAQVSAATADALAAIQRDVMSASITPKLSVEQFVSKTNSRAAVVKAVRGAEQIGGTRWLDDKTCQVRMELPGSAVADALIEIAKAKPSESGLPAEVLRERVERMRDTTFAATGMSTCALDRLRPPPEQTSWRGVPDETLKAAIKEARHDAARQVLENVNAVSLPGSSAHLDKILADPKVHDQIDGWLVRRPVTSVDFKDDLEVRVGVAVDGEALWEEVVSAAGDRKDISFPRDEAVRASVRQDVINRAEPAIGRAYAKPGATAPAVEPARLVSIPREPPAWIAEQLDARGKSARAGGQLKTARAAETAARDQLRGKIEELTLTRKLTLGEAAKRDERLRGAIDRAVQGVRPRKISYLSDGSAEVSLSLDLRDLWYEIDK